MTSTSTSMPQNIRELHEQLGLEANDIVVKMQNYRHLYMSGQEPVDLMTRHAQAFFGDLHALSIDDIILSICRMLDSDKSCGRDNRTIKQLASQLHPTNDSQLKLSLNAHLTDVKPTLDKLLEHRNKRLAHRDLNHSQFVDLYWKDIEECAELIKTCLNDVARRFNENVDLFDPTVLNDWREILGVLRRLELK